MNSLLSSKLISSRLTFSLFVLSWTSLILDLMWSLLISLKKLLYKGLSSLSYTLLFVTSQESLSKLLIIFNFSFKFLLSDTFSCLISSNSFKILFSAFMLRCLNLHFSPNWHLFFKLNLQIIIFFFACVYSFYFII